MNDVTIPAFAVAKPTTPTKPCQSRTLQNTLVATSVVLWPNDTVVIPVWWATSYMPSRAVVPIPITEPSLLASAVIPDPRLELLTVK